MLITDKPNTMFRTKRIIPMGVSPCNLASEQRIDDEPARTSPHAPALRAAGFADGYKGLTLHK